MDIVGNSKLTLLEFHNSERSRPTPYIKFRSFIKSLVVRISDNLNSSYTKFSFGFM